MNSLRNIARAGGRSGPSCVRRADSRGNRGLLPSGSGVSSAAQAAVVNTVSVQGNQRVEASTIRSYITIKPGVSFGPIDVDDSVKSLFADRLVLRR